MTGRSAIAKAISNAKKSLANKRAGEVGLPGRPSGLQLRGEA